VDFLTVEENLRQSFRLLASSRAPGEVREAAGVTIASAGVTFQMFNAAFLSSPVVGERDLESRIATAKVHFQARGLPWSYWVCESWLDKAARRRADEVFRRRGLYLATELPGMLAERLRNPVRELPPLDVRRVADDASWAAFCRIGAQCFNVPLAWFQEVFEDSRVWENGFHGYVGYDSGEPVSTAATVIAGGAVGVGAHLRVSGDCLQEMRAVRGDPGPCGRQRRDHGEAAWAAPERSSHRAPSSRARRRPAAVMKYRA